MAENEHFIQFPTDFPIKIIGENDENFLQDILNLAQKHFPYTSSDSITSRKSQHKTYLAITLTVFALDQPSLDALYRDLSTHPKVKMVL